MRAKLLLSPETLGTLYVAVKVAQKMSSTDTEILTNRCIPVSMQANGNASHHGVDSDPKHLALFP